MISAMQPLFRPPPARALPLARGGDLLLTLTNRDPAHGVPAAWPDGVTVHLIVETPAGPIEKDAEVDGPHARLRIESEQTDLIPNGVLWRAIARYPTTEGDDIVLVNGQVARHDGRR